jgi:alkylation response protein AidB-like acyl-CoA dehydrogenase
MDFALTSEQELIRQTAREFAEAEVVPHARGKYVRDARVATLYEGTSEIQKLIIGRALTGENAFT